MTRVATLAQFQLTLGQTLNTQRQALDLQIQASSGQASRDYAGIAGDSYRLVSLETANARANQYVTNNKQIDRRLQTMETNISQVFDSATRFRTVLLNALNANNGNDIALGTEATNFKQEVANLLNVEQDGRYLFAGSRTDTAPVDLNGWTPPAMPLTPPLTQYTNQYYKGDGVKLTSEVDTNLTVTYGITANDDAFEYVLRAAHYVELAGNPPDQSLLQTALNLVNTALGTEQPNPTLGVNPIQNDLADLRSQIGASQSTLDSVNKRLGDFAQYTDQNIGDIKNVDIPETMSKLSSQQTLLEASYATISRLGQLSLLQYLR